MYVRRRVGALVVAAVAAAVTSIGAQSPTVDEIVAKYLAAKGGADKLRGVTTVKTSGRIKAATGEVPVSIWAKRPNMMRRQNTYDGQTFVIAFDGKTVWAINPMMSSAAREITGPQAEMTRRDAADFDSVLLDYTQKGYKVELIDSDPVGGLATYHLRVTKKNSQVQDVYLNAETMLESTITMEVEQMGKKGTVALEFSNYKPVDGIMVPFTTRQVINGQVVAEANYNQVQFNQPVDDGLFKMPR
jgi:outer membrane lipoprotein-sorting protein